MADRAPLSPTPARFGNPYIDALRKIRDAAAENAGEQTNPLDVLEWMGRGYGGLEGGLGEAARQAALAVGGDQGSGERARDEAINMLRFAGLVSPGALSGEMRAPLSMRAYEPPVGRVTEKAPPPPTYAVDPASMAARASRARDLGYDTPVWHATKKQFDEFRPSEELGQGDFGIHVGLNPRVADYINYPHDIEKSYEAIFPWNRDKMRRMFENDIAGSHTIPLQAKVGKSITLPDLAVWSNPGQWSDLIYDVKRGADRVLPNGEKFTSYKVRKSHAGYPPGYRGSNVDVPKGFFEDLDDAITSAAYKNGMTNQHNQFSKWLALNGYLPEDQFVNDILNPTLDKYGIDSIRYRNLYERAPTSRIGAFFGDREPDSVLLRRGDQLRLPHAEFRDPKSGNLLAGLAAAGLLGAGAAPLLPSDQAVALSMNPR